MRDEDQCSVILAQVRGSVEEGRDEEVKDMSNSRLSNAVVLDEDGRVPEQNKMEQSSMFGIWSRSETSI